MKKIKNKKMPIWKMVVIDISLIITSLCVFALFHHVLPMTRQSEDLVVDSSSDKNNSVEESTNESDNVSWSEKFKDYFSDTVVSTENTYKSSNISITVDKKTQGSGSSLVTYYVADIYVLDIECFKTYFAEDTYGSGYRESVLSMDNDTNALIAINGDYYGNQNNSLVIRNGIVYKSDSTNSDICILYHDGTMKTYSPGEVDIDEVVEGGAYQGWTFGPMLLDNNKKALTSFNTSHRLESENPRTGIGYYEPGHYCMVVIDGRSEGYSEGVTLSEMATIFEELGCESAYNLDGGKSSVMTFNNGIVNQPVGGGRTVSDCLTIQEVDK